MTKEEEDAAAKTLEQAKQDAIKELEDSISLEDYRDAEKSQVEATLNNGKASINAATTTDEVIKVKVETRKEIAEVKTDAILTQEEEEAAAKELAEAKEAAIKELEEAVALEDYRTTEKAEVEVALNEGKDKINAATTIDEVAEVKQEIKQEIAEVKTDDQLTQEEEQEADKKKEEAVAKALADAKEAAIKELEDSVTLEDYRDAEKAEVEATLKAEIDKINAATTIDDVTTAKETAQKEIADIKTDAQLTAKEEAQEFDIIGTVEDDKNQVVEHATVELRLGNELIATIVTEADGEFIFTGLKPGVYNVIIYYEGQIITDIIRIDNADIRRIIQLPAQNVNSIVNIKDTDEDKIQIVVGGLTEEAESYAQNPEDSVTIEMTIEKVTSADTNEVDVIEALISMENAGNMNYKHFDFTVMKTINGENSEKITETNNVLCLVLTFDMTDKKDIVVYRYHDGKAEALIEVDTMPEENYIDGTFYVDRANGLIYIFTQKFSTYTVGYEEVKETEEPKVPETQKTPETSEDVETTPPNTGDDSAMMGYSCLVLLSLGGVSIIAYRRKYA